MVLEYLVKPEAAEKRPWMLFFYGFLYSTIALFMSLWIFREHASIVMIFLTVLACIYLVQQTLKLEEKKDLEEKRESRLLKEHGKALNFLMFLFLGFLVSFAFWYVVLPSETVTTAFSSQMNTITSINKATGAVTGIDANVVSNSSIFTRIFINNLKVLFFCILFAVFYGAGAVFILAWNASVIGVAIGNFIRAGIAEVGGAGVSHYAIISSLAVFRYLTHGVFEIAAYFTAALGAGIISIAFVNHDYSSPKFKHVIIDSMDLILLSLALLLVAALIEVFVTPALF